MLIKKFEPIADKLALQKPLNMRDENGLFPFPNETPINIRLRNNVFQAITVETVVPMPPVLGPTVLILDVSKWNYPMDFSVAYARGIRYVWIKANQGAWPDARFDELVKGALDAGMEIGFYYFVDPTQTTVTPESAAQLTYDMVRRTDGRLSLWIDAERNGALNNVQMLNHLIRYYDSFKNLDPDRIEDVYTRFSWFNPYVARSDFWRNNNVRLSTARYHLGLSAPWSDNNYVPLDFDVVIPDFIGDYWQYSADGNGLGEYFGSSGAISIDLDLFRGTEQDLRDKHNLDESQPPIDPDCCQKLENEIIVLKTQVSHLENNVAILQTDLTELQVESIRQKGSIDGLQVDFDVHKINPDAHHQHEDTQPPIDPPVDPPDDEIITVTITDKKAPAFSYKHLNDAGYPQININVYAETGDNDLVWYSGDEVKVLKNKIKADGGIWFYVIREDINKYGYPELYLNEKEV